MLSGDVDVVQTDGNLLKADHVTYLLDEEANDTIEEHRCSVADAEVVNQPEPFVHEPFSGAGSISGGRHWKVSL